MSIHQQPFVLLVAAVLAGCAQGDKEQPKDPALKHVADLYGADYTGENILIVYARDPDGAPLTGCGSNFCRDEHGIRITIFSNPVQPLERYEIPIKITDRFTYFSANVRRVMPYGFMKYRPSARDTVWIRRIFGPPINSVEAEFNIESSRSVRYSYVASTEADHVRTFNAVSNYLHTVGLR